MTEKKEQKMNEAAAYTINRQILGARIILKINPLIEDGSLNHVIRCAKRLKGLIPDDLIRHEHNPYGAIVLNKEHLPKEIVELWDYAMTHGDDVCFAMKNVDVYITHIKAIAEKMNHILDAYKCDAFEGNLKDAYILFVDYVYSILTMLVNYSMIKERH